MIIIGMEILGSEQSGQRFLMMVSIISIFLIEFWLLQASQQGPSVQVTVHMSASVAQSVSPGHLGEAPGTASTALP